MGESIIQAIVMQMQYELDYRKMAHLKTVLSNEFQKLDIHEKKDHINIHQDNEKLLDAFVSAKKVEGCSDKTLAYYRSTIEHLFEAIDIMACHIETSDIRQYLVDYQEKKKSSKVTIDNMRRIFSILLVLWFVPIFVLLLESQRNGTLFICSITCNTFTIAEYSSILKGKLLA